MFLLYVFVSTIEDRGDGVIASTIYHQRKPDKGQWSIVTFKNNPEYSASRVDHFESFDEAQAYFEREFPAVPLVSLGGRPPRVPMDYAAFRQWELANGFADYDYRRVFSLGGTNAREVILTRKT